MHELLDHHLAACISLGTARGRGGGRCGGVPGRAKQMGESKSRRIQRHRKEWGGCICRCVVSQVDMLKGKFGQATR